MYFQYKTISRISQRVWDSQQTPAFTFCSRYSDIIDSKGLQEDYGIYFERTNENSIIEKYASNLTVKDIFDYTIQEEDVISSCQLRIKDDYIIKKFNKNECYSVFSVKKFLTQQFICFHIRFKEKTHYNFHRVARSNSFRSILYVVNLNKSLSLTHKFIPIVNVKNYPLYSKDFAPTATRLESMKLPAVAKTNKYLLYYSWFIMKLLPPPYDTMCNSVDRDFYCSFECIMKAVQIINKVPYSGLIMKPINMKPITSGDLEDDFVRSVLSEAERNCNRVCGSYPCDFDYTLTSFKDYYKPSHDFIQVYVKTLATPITTSKTEARVSSEEYLIYIFSCFGIWMGVSVTSLNPFLHLDLTKIAPVKKFLMKRRKNKSRFSIKMRRKTSSASMESFFSAMQQLPWSLPLQPTMTVKSRRN
jgi:hypothetical protein